MTERWYRLALVGDPLNQGDVILQCPVLNWEKIEHRVVDFHDVFARPREMLESLLRHRNEPRPQLLPPYREHLSQAFARFFMRVGLPTNVSTAW
jgi:hypothetical protein